MTTQEARSRRLSVDDWVDAAPEIMAADGIGGVKIQRLCDQLGVTKGSFYWHFKDLDAFLDAIAEQWRRGEGTFRSRMDAAVRTDPKGGLSNAVQAFLDRRLGRLERAMRDWSRTDDRARAAIKAADKRTFDALVSGFESLGFSDEDADVRAKILFYAGVGFGDVGPIGDRSEPARQLETLVELLTSR
jgi:AcrR family transcriptional regulator